MALARVVEKMKQRAKNEISTINTRCRETLQETRRRKYHLKEKRIVTIIEKFDSGDYSLNEYINSLSMWMGFK